MTTMRELEASLTAPGPFIDGWFNTDDLGEEVAAVRLRPGSRLDADGVRAHVTDRLAAFKVPTVVDLRTDELPRNAAGKVLKRRLREELDRQIRRT